MSAYTADSLTLTQGGFPAVGPRSGVIESADVVVDGKLAADTLQLLVCSTPVVVTAAFLDAITDLEAPDASAVTGLMLKFGDLTAETDGFTADADAGDIAVAGANVYVPAGGVIRLVVGDTGWTGTVRARLHVLDVSRVRE